MVEDTATRIEMSLVFCNGLYEYQVCQSDCISHHFDIRCSQTLNIKINVFPYSVFYALYKQYLTMVEDAATKIEMSHSLW